MKKKIIISTLIYILLLIEFLVGAPYMTEYYKKWVINITQKEILYSCLIWATIYYFLVITMIIGDHLDQN